MGGLALVAPTDPPTPTPTFPPAVVPPEPTRLPEATRANQDILLQHCIESEMRRGTISIADGVDALSDLAVIRDPGDPYRLGLMGQCLGLGYLDEVLKEDSKDRPTQTPASMPATRRPVARQATTKPPTPPTPTTSPMPTPTMPPTPTPTPYPLPVELTSGVDALVHCAGATVEHWLENGPPTLTADLVGCLNAYLEQVEG